MARRTTTPEEVNSGVPSSNEPFAWAVNRIKLNRAKARVIAANPGKRAEDLEDLIKEEYIKMAGLLEEDRRAAQISGGKRGGRVQNMADDDGSRD